VAAEAENLSENSASKPSTSTLTTYDINPAIHKVCVDRFIFSTLRNCI